MTTEAYDRKKWRGLKNLYSSLSNSTLGDHHYGGSSAYYNKFSSVSDFLKIALLVTENTDKISLVASAETARELKQLSDEAKDWAEIFLTLSSDLRTRATHVQDVDAQRALQVR